MKRNHHFSRYLMLLLVITNETRLNTSTRRRDFAYENFLCEAKLFSSRNIRKREVYVVVCSRSDHESFSGVPFHGNCVVPWIVSVFCQRWLVLRLIGQLDVRPEVAPPEKGHAPLCKYIGNILQFYVN